MKINTQAIVFDRDETLNEYNDDFLKFLCDRYGIKKSNGKLYSNEDLKSYDIWKWVPLPKEAKFGIEPNQ